ncbi:MAG TPA: undecaprenyl-diphosphate phosphatase, partial [Aggregatilineales bacterium]|nr:undecaprenyl-diphosphate phosphatase [Aggregatilineales bacterium]
LRDVERGDSARFSFMLSLPIILGAGLVQLVELIRTGMSLNSALPLIAGFAAAFVSAYFVIRWMLNYLRSRSLTVFAAYCVVASLVSIAVYFVRG